MIFWIKHNEEPFCFHKDHDKHDMITLRVRPKVKWFNVDSIIFSNLLWAKFTTIKRMAGGFQIYNFASFIRNRICPVRSWGAYGPPGI